MERPCKKKYASPGGRHKWCTIENGAAVYLTAISLHSLAFFPPLSTFESASNLLRAAPVSATSSRVTRVTRFTDNYSPEIFRIAVDNYALSRFLRGHIFGHDNDKVLSLSLISSRDSSMDIQGWIYNEVRIIQISPLFLEIWKNFINGNYLSAGEGTIMLQFVIFFFFVSGGISEGLFINPCRTTFSKKIIICNNNRKLYQTVTDNEKFKI